MVGVYVIINNTTHERYIGCSKNITKRWKQHFQKGYGAMHSPEFQIAIDSLGCKGFSFRVLEECEESELKEREAAWIRELKPEYNTIYEGHSVKEETRIKIRKKLTGQKHSEETKAKRRLAIKKRHETIPQTNEWHKKKVRVEIKEWGREIEFPSVKSVAEFFNVDDSTVTKALKRNGKVRGHRVWYVV